MYKKDLKRGFSLWLDLQDSNLRMTGPKPVALPLGEGPIDCNYFTTSFWFWER